MVLAVAVATDTDTSVIETAIAGAASGFFTRAVTQPLDVLKIRFQLQLEPLKHGSVGSKYSSMIQAAILIVKEEGIATLWSGHIPAQFLSVTYGVVQFAVFEKLTTLCCRSDENFFFNHQNAMNFSNGSIAAAAATVVSYPFDTIRTRLIAEQKTKKAYKGFIHAFHSVVKTEGNVALFKGIVPTLAQIAPHAGMQFAMYRLLSDNIFNKVTYFQRQKVSPNENTKSTLLANLIAGSIAGMGAKTLIYPFDMVKKRLQIQGFQKHREGFGKQMYCKGLLDCVRLTIVQEGFMALYKGYAPSMVKAMVVTALHFSTYDEIKYYLKRS